MSVILSSREGGLPDRDSPRTETPPGQRPPDRDLLDRDPLDRDPPPRTVKSDRYPSYWNAFLLKLVSWQHFANLSQILLLIFQIRHNARLHDYVVQCASDVTRNDGVYHFNTGLCCALGLASLIQLVYPAVLRRQKVPSSAKHAADNVSG